MINRWPLPDPSKAGNDARERIAEIGEILALGLIRLRARQSSQTWPTERESSLACVGQESGHANRVLHRESGA
jgi:hypothetical protein